MLLEPQALHMTAALHRVQYRRFTAKTNADPPPHCHGYSGAGVELLSVKRRVTFVQSEEGALQADGKGLHEGHRDAFGARQKGSNINDNTSGSNRRRRKIEKSV